MVSSRGGEARGITPSLRDTFASISLYLAAKEVAECIFQQTTHLTKVLVIPVKKLGGGESLLMEKVERSFRRQTVSLCYKLLCGLG